MNHTIYNYVTSLIAFAIWLYMALRAIKEYVRVMKAQGIRSFMARRQLNEITNKQTLEAIQRWKTVSRNLFLIWVATAFLLVLISMIIDRTIGFKE